MCWMDGSKSWHHIFCFVYPQKCCKVNQPCHLAVMYAVFIMQTMKLPVTPLWWQCQLSKMYMLGPKKGIKHCPFPLPDFNLTQHILSILQSFLMLKVKNNMEFFRFVLSQIKNLHFIYLNWTSKGIRSPNFKVACK